MSEQRKLPSYVQDAIKARLKARQERERLQKELLSKEDLWHSTIAAKIDSLGIPQYVEILAEEDEYGLRAVKGWRNAFPFITNFLRCGTEKIVRTCRSCGDQSTFTVSCSQKFCPRCQWKLVKAREKIITKWAQRIPNAQHICLTQRNFKVITKKKIKEHRQNLAKLRRQDCWKNVQGGSTSIEITNEGRGWHLHSHSLVTGGRINPCELAKSWGSLVGQEYAIVKIKPITDRAYLSELTKYVCKGSDMAMWPAEEIWQFVNAIRGSRFFFQFGSLCKMAPEIRAELEREKGDGAICECGCGDFNFNQPLITEFSTPEGRGDYKKVEKEKETSVYEETPDFVSMV
ncbi:MAG: transposase zinc-binding domain-containing protein [Verrucomicrobiota bacterium]